MTTYENDKRYRYAMALSDGTKRWREPATYCSLLLVAVVAMRRDPGRLHRPAGRHRAVDDDAHPGLEVRQAMHVPAERRRGGDVDGDGAAMLGLQGEAGRPDCADRADEGVLLR